MKKLILITSLLIFTLNNVFAQFPADTVWHPVEPSEISQPDYLQPILDNNHNVNVTRISDATVFGYPNGSSELLPVYSKVQAWNADMTKIAVGINNILNADDYTYYKSVYNFIPAGGFNDGRWSHINPDVRYFCNHEKFYKIDIETEIVTELHTFDVTQARIGPFEGNISANDKYVVITNYTGTKAFLYDIELDVILSSKNFTSFDWVTITPWSNYIAVSNNDTGVVELYDLDFNYLRDLSSNQEHADFGIDTNDNEVLVQVIPLQMTRLDNGQVTDLLDDALVCGNYHFNPNVAGHISCRNFDLPGWALVSTPNSEPCTNGIGFYTITEIFAVKLDGSGTIRHYGYSYSDFINYTGEAKASFSSDGKKVMFSSNWNLFGTNDNNALAYVVEYNNPLSTINHTLKEPITIFPNPANNFIEIKSNIKNIAKITFYNSIGIKIKQTQYKNKIDISNLNSGIYLVKINTNNNQSFIQKLIKK